MSADVIKEFLVSIGFRVDQASNKKFEASLTAATVKATLLADAIEATARTVLAKTAQIARGFDDVYYASQRIGASAANIQALGYGFSQMGSTVGAATSSMENFARTLRNQPNSLSILERMGISTKDVNGAQRSTDQLFQAFGKALRSKPVWLQAAYLEDFGIDERTGKALIQGVDKFADEYREKMRKAGLDPDKAAQDGHALSQTFNSLGASIDIIGQKVASKLFAGGNNALQKFIEFLDQHGDQIAEVIAHLAQVVLELAEAFLKIATSPEAKKWLDGILSAFGKVDEQTGKFTADIDKLKIALGLFGVFVAGSWASKLLGAFGVIGGGWAGLLARLGIVATVGADLAVPNAEKPGVIKNSEEEASGAAAGAVGTGLGGLLRKGAGAVKRFFGGGGGSAQLGGWWTAERQQHAFDTLVKGGVSELGAKALIARWSAVEAGAGPTALNKRSGAFGIGQWLSKDRLDPVRGNTDFDAQLGHALKELHSSEGRALRQLNGATTAGEAAIGASIYERAEGYNASTGVDNFTATTAAAMAKLAIKKAGDGDSDFFPNGAPKVLKPNSMPGAPGVTMGQANARRKLMRDLLPNGMEGVFNGGLPNFSIPNAGPSATSSRSTVINIHQAPVNVTGVEDGKRAAAHVGEVMGYRNSDLVRNMRSSVA